jgi:hypothetical protein
MGSWHLQLCRGHPVNRINERSHNHQTILEYLETNNFVDMPLLIRRDKKKIEYIIWIFIGNRFYRTLTAFQSKTWNVPIGFTAIWIFSVSNISYPDFVLKCIRVSQLVSAKTLANVWKSWKLTYFKISQFLYFFQEYCPRLKRKMEFLTLTFGYVQITSNESVAVQMPILMYFKTVNIIEMIITIIYLPREIPYRVFDRSSVTTFCRRYYFVLVPPGCNEC